MLNSLIRALAGLALIVAFAAPTLAQSEAAPETPGTSSDAVEPEAPVNRLHAALLHVMQNAGSLGFEGRYEELAPVLRDVFDFSAMARFAIGPTFWPELSAAQREEVIDLFAEMSITTYAARFDGYSGQSFQLSDQADAGRGRVLVRSLLLRPDDEPVALDYVLIREEGQGWRIIDVLLDGSVSELARQRAEYTAVLRRQGYDGLVAALEQAIDRRRQG
ncbi:MAG: hopanoid biosynthesis protein HpnM [Alphaproteobacteria bacterium]|nr:hopanoid biosynthesis protein HpnM [Alphaproteobacteria bacterium]